jgi:hypothetical protein
MMIVIMIMKIVMMIIIMMKAVMTECQTMTKFLKSFHCPRHFFKQMNQKETNMEKILRERIEITFLIVMILIRVNPRTRLAGEIKKS